MLCRSDLIHSTLSKLSLNATSLLTQSRLTNEQVEPVSVALVRLHVGWFALILIDASEARLLEPQ